ncbi:hypothetical protein [Kutzneria sp. CA-103260]|uniref:hypothetical protein n=1 Tax=Kutzneria sp. CA-103260 TaxID=2802641 RepID=UPI001BAD24E8|nr:hypothetical protein [Kutzneria sp. CA-103260]QUQ72501.1 hypothetical protein JJ691_102900 [Kutzneria sp. CA-103260]
MRRGDTRFVPAERIYGFRWSEDGSNRRSWSRTLKAAIGVALARAVARVPDEFVDSPVVTRIVLAFLPYVMRLKFHRSAAKTLAGAKLTVTLGMGLTLADGDRRYFLVRVRGRRCAIRAADRDQVVRQAVSCFTSRLPTVLRMTMGASTHPALLIADGAAELSGDVFFSARLAALFGMPSRSLLPVGE